MKRLLLCLVFFSWQAMAQGAAPDEVRPVSLGSVASSKAARPAWSVSGSYAPQYADAPSLFAAKALEVVSAAQLQEALVICQVDASGLPSYDFFGGKNELSARLTINKAQTYGYKRTRKSEDVYISAPLISLKTGDKISVKAYDADFLSSDDPIETLTMTYKGELPLHMDGKRVSLSCVALSREEIEALLPEVFADAEEAFGKVEGELSPGMYQSFLDTSDGIFWAAQAQITSIASLVGWDDPGVKARLARLEEDQRQRQENIASALEDIYTEAPPLADWLETEEGVFAMRAALRCDKKNVTLYKKFVESYKRSAFIKSPCVVEVELENRSAGELPCCGDTIGRLESLSLIDTYGGAHGLELLATLKDNKAASLKGISALAASEQRTLIFAAELKKGQTAKLLRLSAKVANQEKREETLRWNPSADSFFWEDIDIFYVRVSE